MQTQIRSRSEQVTRAGLRSLNAQPLLRVMGASGDRFMWLAKGRAGNLQTAAEMAAMVREDAMRDAGLGHFAAQLLINSGLDSHSDDDEILDCVFRYAQQISYIHDPGGSFDAIHSARETIAKGYGDCDDLSVLLATLLALLGFTPAFVLAQYDESTNGFDHIYVQVETSRGSIALDPTTRKHGIGWENPRTIDRVVFPVFGPDGALNALGARLNGSIAPLATTGAAIGLGFVPVVGPALSLLVGPIAGLFSKAAQKQQEAARWQGHEQVMQAMNLIQNAVNTCQITAAAGAEAARQVVAAFYKACDDNFKSNVAQSCRNYGSESGGFDYRTQKILQSGSSCAIAAQGVSLSNGSPSSVAMGATNAAGVSGESLGGLSVSLPVALAIGLGALLLLKG